MKPMDSKGFDAEVIARVEKWFPDAKKYWEPHHKRFTSIKSFVRVHGEFGQWEESEHRARSSMQPPRITLTENLLGPFVNQVGNDIKKSDFSAQVKPKDSGADPKLANVRQALHRGVQQNGKFKPALDQATDDLIDGGLAAWRMFTQFADPLTQQKEIRYRHIDPPRLFHGDGTHREADFSDVTDSLDYEPYSKEKFKEEFDKDPDQFLNRDNISPVWGDHSGPWVSNYFFKDEIPDVSVRLKSGRDVYLSELKEDIKNPEKLAQLAGSDPVTQVLYQTGQLSLSDLIAKDEDGEDIRRDTYRCQVYWCKIAGREVLAKEKWPGYFIPNFLAVGRKVSINGQMYYYGLAEPARDVQKAHNYALSAMVERAGQAPKTRIIAALESITPDLQPDWDNLNTSGKMVAYYKSRDEGGEVIAPPFQLASIQADPAYALLRETTIQGIRDVLGMWETSLGAQSNEKSGVAIQTRERQSDTGNYNWGASLALAAEHCFRATDEILPKVIDVPMQVRIVGEDEKESIIWAASLEESSPDAGQYFNLNQGKWDLACKMAPGADTQREEQARGMEMIVQGNPGLSAAFAPEYIALQPWKNAEKMAQVAEQFRAANVPGFQNPQQQGIPPQIQQQMEMMQQQLQAMGPEFQKLQQQVAELGLQNKALQADRAIEGERVQIEKFKADTERRKVDAEIGIKQGEMLLQMDELSHAQELDKKELQLTAQGQQHQQDKDVATHQAGLQMHGDKMSHEKDRMSFEAEKADKDRAVKDAKASTPTGAKPGKPAEPRR